MAPEDADPDRGEEDEQPALLCPGCRKPVKGWVWNVQTGVGVEWRVASNTDITDVDHSSPEFFETANPESYWVCRRCETVIRDEDDFIRVDPSTIAE